MKRISIISALTISFVFCSCLNKQYKCFDANDYSTFMEFGSETFKHAIDYLYYTASIPFPDTTIYDIYKWESVAGYWNRYVTEYWNRYHVWNDYSYDFKSINAYEDFLSNESDCNQGKEPLKEFICSYTHDEKFRKSRIKIEGKDKNSIYKKSAGENFKFYFQGRTRKTWEEVGYQYARFIVAEGNDIEESHTFTRIGEKWYLTDYFDWEDIENEMNSL